MKIKRRSYKFTDKRHPILGILSFIIAVIVIIMSLVLCFEAADLNGKAPISYGVAGVIGLLMAIIGFIIGIQSMKQKDIFLRFPILGVFLNGVMILGLFIVYIIGEVIV